MRYSHLLREVKELRCRPLPYGGIIVRESGTAVYLADNSKFSPDRTCDPSVTGIFSGVSFLSSQRSILWPSSTFSYSGTYVLFSVACLAAYFWSKICVPETRGRSLEEMDALFNTDVGTETAQRKRNVCVVSTACLDVLTKRHVIRSRKPWGCLGECRLALREDIRTLQDAP